MGVQLTKGENISLSQSAANLKRILIGLGWEARSTEGNAFDLDASVFMTAENGKVRRDEDFVFYNQLESPCGSVKHSGDNRTGAGDGDDETITVDMEKIPPHIQRLVVSVTIHDAEIRHQNFGQISDAFIRVVDLDTDREIARFDLSEDYSTETGMIFGEIYRHGGDWKFKAVGQGYAGGLEALCRKHGVDVA
jgi:tellurium resistance protein TerD